MDSVKEMLQMDIGLKQELTKMFRINSRKQTVTLILVSFCTVLILILFMFYVSRPNPIDRMVFDAIQRERGAIKLERQSMYKERENIQILRDSIRTVLKLK